MSQGEKLWVLSKKKNESMCSPEIHFVCGQVCVFVVRVLLLLLMLLRLFC